MEKLARIEMAHRVRGRFSEIAVITRFGGRFALLHAAFASVMKSAGKFP
jgi:hypothetical protein